MLANEDLSKLVVRVGRGDQQAFADLFKHFAPRVASYLQRGGTPAAAAEELTQEVMMTMWRKSASFNPSRGAVSTWVFAIARNLRTDQHRSKSERLNSLLVHSDPDLGVDDFEISSSDPLPEDLLSITQRDRRLRDAMSQLSPEMLQLLQLSFFTDSPHSDIARELHMPLGTVKSIIRRALMQIRRNLEASQP